MKTLFDLTGKCALITGASSGMGKAIAEALGVHGATVIISSNDMRACREVCNEFKAQEIDAHKIYCDVSRDEDIDQLTEKAMAITGKIDVLVSCVGAAPTGSFLEEDGVRFAKTLQINLKSGMYLTQKLLPQMVARKDGAIIYLASIAGVRGNKNIGLYGISKAGLIQMVRNIAVEFGPHNIRVNAISPGLIDTPFSKSFLDKKEFMKTRLKQTALGRVGKPEEIAGVAVLLASAAGAFITGQNIIVDGGTTIN